MSAAEALPLPFPDPNWRSTAHITDHIPTPADLATSPPAAGPPAAHLALLQRSLRAADDDLLDALYEAWVEQAFIEHAEHVKDWPPIEPSDWS